MAASKLFTPAVKNPRSDMFVGVPARPEVDPSFEATSGGEACYPLALGAANQTRKMPLQDRRIVSRSQEDFDY